MMENEAWHAVPVPADFGIKSASACPDALRPPLRSAD